MNDERKPNYLFIGMMSVFAGHVIFVALAYALAFFLDRVSADPYIFLLPLMVLITIGITQLLYVIPLALWLNRKRRFATMKGVIIGAVFIALLNGACFLFVQIGSGNF